MKPPFYVKRCKGGAQAVWCRGFVNDTGDQKADIVICVRQSNRKREMRRDLLAYAERLNAAWRAEYGLQDR